MELDTQRYSDSDAEWGKSLPPQEQSQEGSVCVCPDMGAKAKG